MKTAFIIYCRAVGLYALLTLPVILSPDTYIMSLMYVLLFGWFAWAVFTVLSLIINKLVSDFVFKLFSLFIAVVAGVALAYEMIGVLAKEEDIWHTLFVFFPFAAVIAGWISVCMSREKIRSSCMQEQAI